MTHRIPILALICLAIGLATDSPGAETTQSFGAGVHYWRTIDDISDEGSFDEDGLGLVFSYQRDVSPLLKLELDVEVLPDGFAGLTDAAYAPQGYLVLGSGIYAAAGVGMLYSDGEFSDEPFYALRAGLLFDLLPSLELDLNANYRVWDFDALDDSSTDIDTDTVTLGLIGRYRF